MMRAVKALAKWCLQQFDGLSGSFSRKGRIWQRYRHYTMIPRDLYVENLRLAERLAPVEGCVVECGVWRGGMSAGLADVLPGRIHYLFDSFEGLPKAKEIDGPGALVWQANTTAPNYFNN